MSDVNDVDPFTMGSGQGVPAGVYLAEYVGQDTGENDNGRLFRFNFKATTGPHAGARVSCMADASRPPTPRNKLGRTLNGLAMRDLADGERFHPDAAKGKLFTIVVKKSDKPNGGTWVDTILPPQQ
jgi:hypothetical protein